MQADSSENRSSDDHVCAPDSTADLGLRRLQAFVNASSDIVYRMSADWSVMFQLRRTPGQKHFADEAEGANLNWLEDYILPEDQAQVLDAIAAAMRNKAVFEFEHRVRQEDGEVGWTHSRAVPVFNSAGVIEEWFGLATDITAQSEPLSS